MKISIGTIELIKPSSPTPKHNRTLQLSFLDQLSPPFHIHIILFFQPSLDSPDETMTSSSSSLKRSLSETLSLYYPLAGRLILDHTLVDCDDSGAEFVEARFPSDRISGVSENIDDLHKYVPAAPSGGLDVPLAVQVSRFGCGGTSIGVCMSHRVADAMSMVTFVNAWAKVNSRLLETLTLVPPPPVFGSASRFPPADFSTFFAKGGPPPPPRQKVVVTRRLVFDERKLEAVRAATMKEAGPTTRVEAVSAFIWRHLIESSAAEKDGRIFMAAHAVDIRVRASPPFPAGFFGNACARAMVTTTITPEKLDYYELAMKLRGMIRECDEEYVTRLEDGDEFLKNEENNPAGKATDICVFSSWSRLPAYEADFGWGKPDWISIVPVHFRNMIIFTGTKSGDGIEAWLSMVEEDIDSIENSFRLL